MGGNVRTIEGYAVLDFEVSEFSSFRDISKNHFVAISTSKNSGVPYRMQIDVVPEHIFLMFNF